jgi:hypothetical protein
VRLEQPPEEAVIGVDLDPASFACRNIRFLVYSFEDAGHGCARETQEEHPLAGLERLTGDLRGL